MGLEPIQLRGGERPPIRNRGIRPRVVDPPHAGDDRRNLRSGEDESQSKLGEGRGLVAQKRYKRIRAPRRFGPPVTAITKEPTSAPMPNMAII